MWKRSVGLCSMRHNIHGYVPSIELLELVGILYIVNGLSGRCYRAASSDLHPQQANDFTFFYRLAMQYMCTIVFMIGCQVSNFPATTPLAGVLSAVYLLPIP